GAVAVAQLEKVRDVVERRIHLGRVLTERIADAPGITALPLSDDYEVSWWNYIFHITGHDPDEFAAALRAEGVSVGVRYIQDPIYMRGDFLVRKVTYGKTQCPFSCPATSREYEYGPELVPDAVKGLKTVAVMGLHEHMGEDDIVDMAAAICKVADGLSA
ncbi:hypothetical protein HOK31_18720, partial [Candidatus Poribacteria bacterium]|nr:hypothetical protein [Candidatus Poribacteria bacterium]